MATAYTSWFDPPDRGVGSSELVIRGQRRDLGLGGFPLVSLKEARDQTPSPTASSPGPPVTRWPRSMPR